MVGLGDQYGEADTSISNGEALKSLSIPDEKELKSDKAMIDDLFRRTEDTSNAIKSEIDEREWLIDKLPGVVEYFRDGGFENVARAAESTDIPFKEMYFALAPQYLKRGGGQFDLKALGEALSDVLNYADALINIIIPIDRRGVLQDYVRMPDGENVNEERFEELKSVWMRNLAKAKAEDPSVALSGNTQTKEEAVRSNEVFEKALFLTEAYVENLSSKDGNAEIAES